MATTSLWKVKSRVDHVVNYAINEEKTENKNYDSYRNNFYDIRDTINYAINPDKTEKQFYTTGINCEVKDAIKQMEFTKRKFNKEKGILAFHGYQSFEEGEVTPEIAHEIGVRLAEEMWGDRFEVVVSTHLNTNHIHNHFVLNSVSFKDGLKYYSNLANTSLLRKTSDDLCDEYGLRVLEEKTCKSGINFENFYKKSIRDSDYYIFAKEDIDYAIKHSYTTKEFHQYLAAMGYSYYYRADKLCIKREPYKRCIRVERAFGEEYSVEGIKNRILKNSFVHEEIVVPYRIEKRRQYFKTKTKLNKIYKPKGIVALYYYYKFLLGFYEKKQIPHKLTPQMRADIKKMEHYSEMAIFLCKYKLETTKDIIELKENKLQDTRELLNTRNRLYYKRNNIEDEMEKEKITKQIMAVTGELKKTRKDIRFCDEVYDNSIKVKENLKEMNKKEQEKVKAKEEQERIRKEKKKDRRYDR